MTEKRPVGRPPKAKPAPKVQTPLVPTGPCIVCKRMTKEIVDFGDKQMFLHNFDCEGPRPG